MSKCAIVWFRRDLRLADNPALHAAVDRGFDAVVPVYIHAPDELGDWAPGAAQRVWLAASLHALAAELAALGAPLVIRRGPSLAAIEALIAESGAEALLWNRLYDPHEIAHDSHIKSQLGARADLVVESFQAHVLQEPWKVATQQGAPYKVFTPFWKNIHARSRRAPLARPNALPPARQRIDSLDIDALALRATRDWGERMLTHWQPGEAGAQARLAAFFTGAAARYDEGRNRPGVVGTSGLSPHLHWGEISPFQVMREVDEWLDSNTASDTHAARFASEIGWREFAHHILFHFPHTPDAPLDARFNHFPWSRDDAALDAWRRGQTGIPMVDAGMRELWATGYMHNRLRMTVASFLTKNLLVSWRHGARWFWDTLVDADLAANTLGWQWAAGCGADAAPFFRIFNPARQGQRFDPDGTYVRRWVPELAALPDRHLHEPWAAPAAVLALAGVTLGRSYPKPLVDLKASRREALAAFEQLGRSTRPAPNNLPDP